MLKLQENPPICHPGDVRPAPPAQRWWVAHTKSRHEKALAQVLCQWENAYFLPMLHRIHVARGRRIRSLVPLFPGYLFFTGDDELRYRILTTNRVAQILYVEDQARLVEDLVQIRRALVTGAPLRPYPFLAHGTRCRVTCGAFRGLEGIVQRWGQGTQLVLQVEALGQAVALEIDAGMVERAD